MTMAVIQTRSIVLSVERKIWLSGARCSSKSEWTWTLYMMSAVGFA